MARFMNPQKLITMLADQEARVKNTKDLIKTLKVKTPQPTTSEYYYSIGQVADELKITTKEISQFVKELEENEGYVFERNGSGHRLFSHNDLAYLCKRLEIPTLKQIRKDRNAEAGVILVAIAKGGVGKTTVTTNLAAQFALSPRHNARVAVLDLDPQGFQRYYLSTNKDFEDDDNFYSVIDFFNDENVFEKSREERAELKEFYRNKLLTEVAVPTKVKNLTLFPSVLTDESFIVQACKNMCDPKFGKDMTLSIIKDAFIEPLKDDFDIIIIDMNPTPTPLLWSALHASNHVLMPVGGDKSSVIALEKFTSHLISTIEDILPSDFEGLDSLAVMGNNLSENTAIEKQNKARILGCTNLMLPAHINRSIAFMEASEKYIPVQLLTDNKKPVKNSKDAIREVANSYFDSCLSLTFLRNSDAE